MKKHLVKKVAENERLAAQLRRERWLAKIRLRTRLRRTIETAAVAGLWVGSYTVGHGFLRGSLGLVALGATLIVAWVTYRHYRTTAEEEANCAVGWLETSSATLRTWRFAADLYAARVEAGIHWEPEPRCCPTSAQLQDSFGRAEELWMLWSDRWLVGVGFEREMAKRLEDHRYEVELCRRVWSKQMGWDPLLECL